MLLTALFMLACIEEHESQSAAESLASIPIRLDVNSTTRALIEEYNQLKVACNPNKGADAIGIWSAYELDDRKVRNVLGNPTGDVALQYFENTEWDNYNGWSYGESAVFWTPNAKYTFNAYFPMDVIDEISTSNISTFVIDYNTEVHQDDLMMAYAFSDTGATGFSVYTPVTLNMLHTLSAVRFQFLFKNSDDSTFEDSDRLTACWLENTATGTGLATTGMLAFGTAQDDGTIDGEHIHWYNENYPSPSTPTLPRRIYFWEDASGVPFSSTPTEVMTATTHSTGDGLYASNNGWIMVIPQQIDESVQLCFKIATTGDLVHRINLSATRFEAGMRYTFNIRFGQSDVGVSLTIADWNELKSSYDIAL